MSAATVLQQRYFFPRGRLSLFSSFSKWNTNIIFSQKSQKREGDEI